MREIASPRSRYHSFARGVTFPALMFAMVTPHFAYADSITTWSVNVYVSATPGGNANQGFLPIGGSESYGSNYAISNIPAGSQMNNSGGSGATFAPVPSQPGLTSATLGITSQNATNPPGATIANANAYGNLATGSIGVSTNTTIEGVDGGNAAAEVWMADQLTFNIPGATASTVTNIGVHWTVAGGGLSSGQNGASGVQGALYFTGGAGSPAAHATTEWSTSDGVISGGVETAAIGFVNSSIVSNAENDIVIDGTLQLTGPNPTLPLELFLNCTSSNDTSCNFISTEAIAFTLPQGVAFTSASGVFLSQPLSVCNYSLSSGGQSFAASGGSATIAVTAPAGCSWSVTGTPNWVTVSSGASGTGNGAVVYQVAANTGAALSTAMTIGGQSYTVEQVAGSSAAAALVPVGSLGQVNSQDGWAFELDAVNLGNAAATARINFTDSNGNPMLMPLFFPQTSSATLPELAATLDRTIAPNARIVMDSSGPSSTSLLGSGQLLSNGSMSGFGIFSYPAFNWNAVVPLETRKATTYSLPFDNTGVLTTGVALSNITTSAVSVKVTILSDAGTQIGTDTLTFASQGFQQFLLPTKYPQTAAARGTIQFQTISPGQISVLGVRANGTAALTTLPVLSNVDSPGGSISDLTYGGGFTSTFYLVNTGNSSAPFTLSFFDQSGNPANVALSLPQTTSTQTTSALTQTLAAGQMLEVATQTAPNTSANISGSAQLASTGDISGFEIFDYSPNGQEASVPLETRTPKNFILVYDNTNGLTTGVALANDSATAATVTANIFDDQGNSLQTTTISLSGHAQQTIVLNSAYTVTANRRGMVQFVVPSSGPISMIGIRVGTLGATTTTTIPILTQ